MSAPARHNPVVGVLWMIAAAVAFALMLTLVRHLTARFSVFEIAFFRLLLGTVVMLPWLVRRGREGLRTRSVPFYCARAVFMFLATTSAYYSLTLIAVADTVALQFTLPIFTAAMAAVALKEPLYAHRWIAVVFGLAGALIIVRPGFAEVNLGVLIALGAAFLYAGGDVTTRFLAGRDGINTILFYGFIVELSIAAVPAALTWVTPSLQDLPALIAFAAFGVGAQVCITRSFATAEASLVSPVLYLRLPLVAAIGWALFDELPSVWTWVGAAILFASTCYSTRRDAAIARPQTAAA